MSPSIGIFWYHNKKIIPFKDEIPEVREIDGFKDSERSHFEEWEQVQKMNATFKHCKYEDVPRGRVILNCSSRRFVVYSSSSLSKDMEFQRCVTQAFSLAGSNISFVSDTHYEDPCSIDWED
jgi:hypothetical protein